MLTVQRMSNGVVGGPRARQASSIYREAVSGDADVAAEKTPFVSRVLRRVRLTSPSTQVLASRRPPKKGLLRPVISFVYEMYTILITNCFCTIPVCFRHQFCIADCCNSTGCQSVRLSVCLSVRHVPVFCPDE